MANDYFRFKQFIIHQDQCAMKVCTDSCVFGAWAAKQIEQSDNQPERILDIGGGTGLLSLMLAQKTNAEIDAAEIERKAFLQMSENFSISSFSNRLHPINSDIRKTPLIKYDIIISNPPFFERDLKGEIEEDILAMHDSGLLLEELMEEIKKRLKEGGKFFILIPLRRMEFLETLFKKFGTFASEKVLLKHSDKTKPFRVIYQGSFSDEKEKKVSEISIYSGDKYSGRFVYLLKEYYLHL